MATRNTVTDEYVVKASIADTASPGLDKLTASMGAADKAAASLADKAASVGDAIAVSGSKFSTATTQFDQIAKRYDDVTKLSLQLTAAQNELARAQTSGQTALAAGTTTQAAYAVTIAGIMEKIGGLAAKLGDARGSLEALSESTARWNGIASQGAEAVAAFANGVAGAAGAAKIAAASFAQITEACAAAAAAQEAWNASLNVTSSQSQANTTADRAADIAAYGIALDAMRSKFDPVFAAQQTFQSNMAGVSDALRKGAIDGDVATTAMDGLAATYAKAGGAIQTVMTAADASAARTAAATQAIEAWNIATVKATESQRLWNATSGVITDSEAADQTAARAADIAAYGIALDATRAKFDPMFAAQQTFIANLARASDALKTGAIDEATASAAMDNFAAAYTKAGGVITTVVTAEQAMADKSAAAAAAIAAWTLATNNAANAQAAFNEQLGVLSEQQAADRTAASAADIEAYSAALDQQSAALDNLRAKYDPVFAANQRYATTLAEIAELQREGSTSAETLAAATAAAGQALQDSINPVADTTTKVQNLSAAHNQAAFATRQLGVQTVQFSTMVATGSPILLALIQQGHQLIDVALATGTGFEVITNGVKAAWSAISGFVVNNPMLVSLLALTAASTALVAVEQSRAAELNDLQQKIRGVTDDYQQMGIAALNAAHAIAASSNLSLSDAKVGTAAFAAAPGIAQIAPPDSAAFAALVKTSADASVALGISVPDAEKKFAAAILDAGSLVSEFTSRGLFGMNAEFERSIKKQVASGDALGAFQRVMDQVNSKTHDALQPVTDLGKAWEALKNAFTGASGGAESLSSALGKALSDVAKNTLREITAIVNAVNWARSLLSAKDTAATPSASASATNNGILTSSAGALGLGQVMPGTAAQFGLDPTVAAQNVKAAYLYQDQLAAMKNRAGVTMFPSQTAVDGAYNAGPGRTNPAQAATYAAALAKVNATDLPADTAALIQSVGEALGKTQAVIDHMKTLVMAESTGNQFFKGVGLSPPGGGSATTAAATPTPDQMAINSATKQAVAGGTAAFTSDAAAAQVANMEKGLAALGRQGVTSGVQFDAFTQELQKSQLALQNAIPATDAQGQAINREVVAAQAMTDAYAQGLPAVALQTAHNLALTQVNSSLARGTDEYKIEVEKLTQANLANADAHGSEQSASTLAATQRQTEAVKAVTAAIAAGLPEQARAIAAQAAKNSVEATFLVSGEAYTKAVKDQTEANLAAAQATGTQQIDLQATALDRATAASLRVANAYKVSEAAGAAMEARVQAETAANAAGLAGTDAWTASVEKNTAAILAGAAADAQKALALGNIPLDKSIVANNAMAVAYAKGTAAVALMTAQEAAEAQLVSTKLYPGTIAYSLALADRTKKNLEVAASAEKVQAGEETHSLDNQITMIQAETATLGMNADQRTLLLAHMQSELELRDKYKASFDDVGVKILAERDRLAALTLSYQNIQTNLSYVSGQVSQSFDTIGNAMTQAFISGQGAAVKWGNVMSSVAQQVLQQFLKLAVLNPILNGLFSQNNPTLSSVSAALNATSGGGATTVNNGNGTYSLVSSGGTVLSTASTLSGLAGGPTIGSTLGLTGPNGLLSGASSYLFGSGAGLPSLAGATSGQIAGATATNGLMSESALAGELGTGQTTAAASPGLLGGTIGGASLASWAGGIGGGFAAGSLVGGLLQSSMNKTGPAPTIGAGAGAVGGAVIGTLVLPGVGTVLGGLLGGLLGGAGGGLIGPHVASMYSSQGISINNGQFATGRMLSQIDPNAAAEEAQVVTDTNTMNAFMATNNLILTSLGKITQLGDNTPGRPDDPTKAANLAAAFPNFRFSSSDPIEADKLADKSFASSDELQTWVTTFNQVQASAKAYLTDTAAVLKDLGATSGSAVDSVNALNAAYDNDKTTMDGLIASGDLSAQQTVDLTKAETDLASIRDKSLQAVNDAVAAHFAATDTGLTSRDLTAKAQLADNPLYAMQVSQAQQLYAFDANATQQRAALKADLISVYGDTVTTTETFAQQMAVLEQTLSDERLAITSAGAKAILAYEQQVADQFTAIDTGLVARDMTAKAQTPADAEAQQLYAFDTNAAQQRATLKTQMVAVWGDTVTSSQGYAQRMALLEQTLGDERLAIVTAANKAILAQQQHFQDTDTSLQSRDMTALATISGNPADAKAQQLYAFDVSAANQRTALTADMVAAYGQSYTATADYAQRMALLEKTLGDERLAITVTANKAIVAADQQAAGAATSFVTSLTSFIKSIQQGTSSPLSPKAQLDLAQTTFSATSKAATGGDAAAMGNFQTDAQGLLTAAKAYYGSSSGYVAAFNQVLSASSKIQSLGPDTLTASFLALQTQTQTTTLVAELEKLRLAVVATSFSVAGSGIAANDNGAVVAAAADGGWIGNGLWGRDSVRAAYAGGGNVMLAGGEFVVSAPSAAKYAAVLPSINAGSYANTLVANDSGTGAQVVAELRALRQQAGTSLVGESRTQTADIVEAVRLLRAEVSALRGDIARSTLKPARLSA